MGKYIHPYNTIISPTKVRRLDTDGRFDQPMVRFGIVPYRTDSEPTKASDPNREKKKRKREKEREIERKKENEGGEGGGGAVGRPPTGHRGCRTAQSTRTAPRT